MMRAVLFFLFAALPVPALAADINIAVASNFRPAIEVLARRFETQTGNKIILIFGSSGKQYAQIANGAPFDAYFAADSERPGKLEEEGLAVPGSRFTYALGQLVLWSPTEGYVDSQGIVLQTGDFGHLAIANPKLAPYGAAAQEALEALGLWDTLSARLVQGENVAQAFHFVRSGAAELGLVALSQVRRGKKGAGGSLWLVPADLYRKIEQQAVLLKDTAPTRAFLQYVRSPAAKQVITRFGYRTP